MAILVGGNSEAAELHFSHYSALQAALQVPDMTKELPQDESALMSQIQNLLHQQQQAAAAAQQLQVGHVVKADMTQSLTNLQHQANQLGL